MSGPSAKFEIADESRPSTAEDYEYDYKDRVVINTAFAELKQTTQVGYRYGLVTFASSYLVLHQTTKWKSSSKIFGALFFGVGAMNLYTHKARSYYAHAASNFNRKSSIALNAMMS